MGRVQESRQACREREQEGEIESQREQVEERQINEGRVD